MAAKNKSKTQPIKTIRPAPKASAQKAKSPSPRTETFQSGFWSKHWLPALLLLVLAFALYGASTQFGYLLDDEMVIWGNQYVQQGFNGLRNIFGYDSFLGYFQDKQKLFLLEGGRYRPLSLATFAAEVGIFGKDNPNLAHISHTINILLYGLTGTFLYRILLGLFPIREGGKWYFSLAFVAALLFVVHPLHTECIANIKGRDEILALLGSLAALYAALKYYDSNNFGWLAGSGVALFLAMMAKENALTFLAIIPFTVWFFTKVSFSRTLASAVPLLLAAILFIIVRFNALGFMVDHGKAVSDIMNDPFVGMSIGEKFATIFLTLGWYIKLLFVPYPLTHDYYPYQVPKVGWSDWRALLSLALYVGMGVWALLNIRKRSLPAYAILFWLITLSIVSNLFISVGTFMNERFTYMPSIAFCMLAAWFLTRKFPEWIKEKEDGPSILGAIILLAILGLFAWRTLARVPDWKDMRSLNTAAVKVSTNSCRAHTFYTRTLFEDDYSKATDPAIKKALVDLMEYHVERSLQINPNYGAALVMKFNVATARFQLDHQLDKFFHQVETVMEKIPYNTIFRENLDKYMVYLNGSNSDKYISFCHRAGYDFYYKDRKDPDTALKFLQYGLDRQTEDIRILDDMAEIYMAIGQDTKAIQFKARANAQR